MGRVLRRVPLDFEWPLGKKWKGFVNPFYKHRQKCPDCKQGYNPATQRIYDELNMYELSQADVDVLDRENRLGVITHEHVDGHWRRRQDAPVPTPDLLRQLDYRHDSINRYYVVKARAEAADVYGLCTRCDGVAHVWESPEHLAQAIAWQHEDPPQGPGYQMWEDTSEGSPITPVFRTPEELAAYCADNVSWFGSTFVQAERWLEMIQTEFRNTGILLMDPGDGASVDGVTINNGYDNTSAPKP